MFDTAAFTADIIHPPNIDLLIENGCKPIHSKFNGEPYKLVLNSQKGTKEPRVTFSKNPFIDRNPFAPSWYLKAEVSIGAWLQGSNLYLPTEESIQLFYPRLSNFIFNKTAIRVNPQTMRLTRLDVTKDFLIGESKVLEIIKALNQKISKYNCRPFNDTGIVFENKGVKKNKKIEVYSKYHELLDKRASEEELELAKGLLRLEIQNKDNRAVSYLAKSLKLPNHLAGILLTRETHERVIGKTMNMIGLNELLESPKNKLQILAETYNSSMPLILAGHLWYKSKFGHEYGELPFINLSAKTIQEYDRKCAKAGILSLE